jgi:hypothetical protein
MTGVARTSRQAGIVVLVTVPIPVVLIAMIVDAIIVVSLVMWASRSDW